jgi:3-oxoacyl-[acyl-carrier protein] reductase
VNAVNPGLIITEGSRAVGVVGSPFEAQMLAGTPLGRVGQPQDVATVVAFLASADSGWLSGQMLYAAGGFTS